MPVGLHKSGRCGKKPMGIVYNCVHIKNIVKQRLFLGLCVKLSRLLGIDLVEKMKLSTSYPQDGG